MLKVAITGSNGLIGSRILELLGRDFQFIDIPQIEVDITNENQILSKIQSLDFDLFLHLAAYTNVDGAEQNQDLAYKVNVDGTRNIFEAVKSKNKKMIYISTDFIFDGENPPYDEKSSPNPISYYGKTKYEGEKIVQNEAMIVRLSYPYRAIFEQKKDFARTIKSLLEQGKTLQMVTDSTITPTFIDDIVYSLSYLMNNYSPEIFHIVGENSLTSYMAGKLIAKIFGLDQNLIQETTYDKYFDNKAKRPKFSEIKTKKNNFYKMKSFEEGLNEVAKQLQ